MEAFKDSFQKFISFSLVLIQFQKKLDWMKKNFFFFLLQKNSIIPFKHFTGTKIPLSSLLRYHASYFPIVVTFSSISKKNPNNYIQKRELETVTKKNKLLRLNRMNNAYAPLYPFRLSRHAVKTP